MKMSAGVERGTRVCLLLTEADVRLAGRPALAEHSGLHEAYLAKQFKKPVAEGILDALPGPAGGYWLATGLAPITLFDGVEAIEGADPSVVCTEIRQQGYGAAHPDEPIRDGIVKTSMLTADTPWRDPLRAGTIRDLAAKLSATVTQRYLATTLRRQPGPNPNY